MTLKDKVIRNTLVGPLKTIEMSELSLTAVSQAGSGLDHYSEISDNTNIHVDIDKAPRISGI